MDFFLFWFVSFFFYPLKKRKNEQRSNKKLNDSGNILEAKKVKIVIISSLLFLSIYIIHHYYALITPPKLLYLSNNTDFPLLSQLRKQGADLNILDYRHTKRFPNIKEGWVRFDPKVKLTRETFVSLLSKKQREPTRRIVMYAGDSIHDFALRTAKQTRLNPKEILGAYHRYAPYRDGGILAGYYQIPYDTTSTAIAYYCTFTSQERLTKILSRQGIDPDAKERKRILILASIIQRETQNRKEMPLIASVIKNRLKKDMKLQLDATLNYGRYSHTIITPQRIKEDQSRYNTYRYKGLPPEPIGSASEVAVQAVIHPAKSDYLYFMLATNGSHNFTSTYQEHLEHIRWFKKMNEDNQTK